MSAVLDTHAAIWYLLDAKNLSETVFLLIDSAAANGSPTYISAISLVEVVYLVERGRIAADAYGRFAHELSLATQHLGSLLSIPMSQSS